MTRCSKCGDYQNPILDAFGRCDDCIASDDATDEARTYHVEFSPSAGTYRVIEYHAAGDWWIVVAEGLSYTEARRRSTALSRPVAG